MAESVAAHTGACAGGDSGPEVDHGVANHQGVLRHRSGACHQLQEPRRLRLARLRAVAAKHQVRKVRREPKAVENRLRCADRLVGEHGECPPCGEGVEQFRHPLVRDGMTQQPAVVDAQELLEGIGRQRQVRRGERAGNEERRAVAHHPADRLFRMRRAATRLEHGIRRLGNVAPRIDERPVEIEDEQRRCQRHGQGRTARAGIMALSRGDTRRTRSAFPTG